MSHRHGVSCKGINVLRQEQWGVRIYLFIRTHLDRRFGRPARLHRYIDTFIDLHAESIILSIRT